MLKMILSFRNIQLNHHTAALIMSFALALLLFLLAFFISFFIYQYSYQQLRDKSHAELQLLSHNIENFVNKNVYLSRGLSVKIAENSDISQSDFHYIAVNIINKSKAIRNVGIIQGYEMVKVYPLKGNKAVLGLRFDRLQVEAFLRAIDYKQSIVTGPISLLQGGRGLIIRTPVFDGLGDYWGQVSLVIDWHKMLEELHWYDFIKDNLLIVKEFSSNHMLISEVFKSDSQFSNKMMHSEKIYFAGNYWQLSSIPRETFSFINYVIFFLPFLVAAMLVVIYYRHLKLTIKSRVDP